MLYFLTIYIIIVMLELAATNGGKKWRGLKILTFFVCYTATNGARRSSRCLQFSYVLLSKIRKYTNI